MGELDLYLVHVNLNMADDPAPAAPVPLTIPVHVRSSDDAQADAAWAENQARDLLRPYLKGHANLPALAVLAIVGDPAVEPDQVAGRRAGDPHTVEGCELWADPGHDGPCP